MSSMRTARIVVSLLVPIALACCAPTQAPVPRAPASASASAPIDDGQIAEAIDAIDLQQGYLLHEALKRGTHPEVRALASELLADHAGDPGDVLARLRRERAGLQPAALVQLYEAQSRETRAWLSTVSDGTFDRDFLAGEIKEQSRAIGWLDHVLLPGVHDAGLRALLVHRRQIATDRLAETKQIATRLGAPA
jgi:predicted outer membrane protein